MLAGDFVSPSWSWMPLGQLGLYHGFAKDLESRNARREKGGDDEDDEIEKEDFHEEEYEIFNHEGYDQSDLENHFEDDRQGVYDRVKPRRSRKRPSQGLFKIGRELMGDMLDSVRELVDFLVL